MVYLLNSLEVEYILGKLSLLLSASKLNTDSHYLNLLNNLRLQSFVIAFILFGSFIPATMPGFIQVSFVFQFQDFIGMRNAVCLDVTVLL